MFYKIIHFPVTIYPSDLLFHSDSRTRQSNQNCYKHIQISKDAYKYSFYPCTFIKWNQLPSNRKQCVIDHKIRPSMQNIQASVPQGSVLGPVLFLLFVNDLPLFINETYIELYADDATVHYANKNKNVVQMKLQNGTDGFLSWCLSNKMFVHFQKTSAMWVGVWQTLQGLHSLDIYLANEKIQQVE